MKNITGIILAGGKSRRMGKDKGLLEMNGKTFTQHIIDQISPLVDEIIIVSNQTEYDKFMARRITDKVKDYGPIAGIYSGLKASKTDYNLVVSCDTPFVDQSVLLPLLAHQGFKHGIVQYTVNGKTNPTVALYHKNCASVFKLAIENNIHKLRFVIHQLDNKTIKADDLISSKMINLNTPEDLIKYNVCV